MGERTIWKCELMPIGRELALTAVTDDGRQMVYKRRFAPSDQAHAQYFTRLVRERGTIDLTHWAEIGQPEPSEPTPGV